MPERHRPNPDEEDNKKISRRGFLFAVGAGAALAGKKLLSGEPKMQAADALPPTAPNFKIVEANENQELEPSPSSYDMGEYLSGKEFSGLFTDYTGISGKAENREEIDFKFQLEQMWKQKLRAAGKNPKVSVLSNLLREEYGEMDKGVLEWEAYKESVDGAVGEVKRHLDFKTLAKLKHLNPEQSALLERISQTIEGSDLLAYALTELMPSENGDFNVEILKFLVKNAGRRYVESIPSLNDKLLSFGPYQFTEQVFAKDARGKKLGVLQINELLPDQVRIPEQLEDLRGEDHYKAAYLFLIENLAHLLKELKGSDLKAFASMAKDKSSIITYAATAHHKPAGARRGLVSFIEKRITKPFSGGLETYARKTKKNFLALTRHLV